MKKISNMKDLLEEKNGYGLIIMETPKEWTEASYEIIVTPIIGNYENFILSFDYREDVSQIVSKLNLLGFNFVYEQKDIKPFLENNCHPWSFLLSEKCDFLSFNTLNKKWEIESFDSFIPGIVYLNFNYKPEVLNSKYYLRDISLVDFLNNNQITPNQVYDAYISLGWLGKSEYVD